ncbi:MAG: hypothetical protein EZS28_032564 [Streblomastix strix]|uniref:Uncharacterized protein n=1 Tax=Streblomastix strix TaxID=222440 RepID=A0A5J4UPI8_9EUKA|nr:MAG: hypothetical protein EZS28_032564 [Streblomastix strix]
MAESDQANVKIRKARKKYRCLEDQKSNNKSQKASSIKRVTHNQTRRNRKEELFQSVVEQSEPGDKNRKFFQPEHQPTLLDIERQVTSKQMISKRTQTIMAKLLKVITRTYITEIDFSATNIQDEQNGEAHRKKIW